MQLHSYLIFEKKKNYLFFFFLFSVGFLNAQIKNVWAIGDGEKIFKTGFVSPEKNINSIWNGHKIQLKGLYNEILAFQVVLETDTSGAKQVSVEVQPFIHQVTHQNFGSASDSYGDDGCIDIFIEHYLFVKDSTHPNWYYGSPKAMPQKMTGWIPDALIPISAYKNIKKYPIDLSPLSEIDPSLKSINTIPTQAFWIDVYLPRDKKSFQPGSYTSKVIVRESGKVVKTIPIELELLPLYLPDTNQHTIWLYTENVYPYFPSLSHNEIDRMLKFEGHKHRVDIMGGFTVNKTSFNAENLKAYLPYLNGDAYRPNNGYEGPGIGVGEKIFPIGMYGDDPVMGNDSITVQQQANLWVSWFKKFAPNVQYFWYLIDEPKPEQYSFIKKRHRWIENDTGIGKFMPLFTTTSYTPELKSIIKYWAGYDGLDLSILPTIQKLGGDHWFYNGNRPRYGSIILEASAVDCRVNSWIMYKYGVNVWFIWNGTQWQHNHSGPKRDLYQRIYSNPLTYINNSMEWGNGDGIMFYPGNNPFYPDENFGLNQLFPSIRLQNMRRGQQDAAILELVEKKVGRNKVLEYINKVVPAALSEVPMDAATPWSLKGNDYDNVRLELLKCLQN